MKQTIIMITHNLELAKVADKIIEIADGRIVGEENEYLKILHIKLTT